MCASNVPLHKDTTYSLHISHLFIFLLPPKPFKARTCQVVLTRRVTPCSGTITNLNVGECWYVGDSEKQNLDRMRDKITFSSIMVKCWPTQTQDPNPNGI